jgi:enolase-phosphatase E1
MLPFDCQVSTILTQNAVLANQENSFYQTLSDSVYVVKSEPVEAILTDIEGTTTSISFVHDVLFPYAKMHMKEFVQSHVQELRVSSLLKEVNQIAGIPTASLDETIDVLRFWMEQDQKITPLKALQGMLWEDGYEKGHFQGHVFADAFKQLKKWKELGIGLYVYSSGSVQAQKLLFSHSTYGDLTPLFSGYFDTNIGMKKERNSYERIAEQIDLLPEKILFLSDSIEELNAARAAGMQTLLLCRDQDPIHCSHPCVKLFSQIDVQ